MRRGNLLWIVALTMLLSCSEDEDSTKEATGGFVLVPAGSFVMGDSVAYCGTDQHQVTLTHDFYLGQTEVTNQQYLEALQWAYDHGYVAVEGDGAYDRLDGQTSTEVRLIYVAKHHSEIGFADGLFSLYDATHGLNPTHPVKELTWYGAAAYCDWVSLREGLPRAYNHQTWECNGGNPYTAPGYRLPTDAEWEYAAQYDDERTYPWGSEAPSCDRANYYNCNSGWTEPVGTQVGGPEKRIGGKGLYDMAGNVWEWCNDWHECDLGTSATTDPPGPSSGSSRVLRGAASHDFGILRCAYRLEYSPAGVGQYGDHGFRIARTVNP